MSSHENVSRRTLARGIAWAVPVIAVGAAAPTASASAADCSAVTVTATCVGNRGSKFCISSTRAINSGSKFAISASGFAFLAPSIAVNLAGLSSYFISGSAPGGGLLLTAVTAVPANTQLCFTTTISGGAVYTITITLNTININGGSDCAGGAPSNSTTTDSTGGCGQGPALARRSAPVKHVNVSVEVSTDP